MIKLSDQQIKLGNISLQAVAETENSLQESYTSINHQSRENKSISARAMGRIENYISKPKAIIFKKIRRFINSTVKTLQLLNTIILQHSNNCLCPVILVKC
jgi:hypothetical protein